MKKDEKVIQMLKYLKNKGLKKTTCFALAIIMLTTNWAAYKDDKIKKVDISTKTLEYTNSRTLTVTESLNEVSVNLDNLKEPSNEEKIDTILKRENITREEFDVIAATVMGEAAPESYEDAYAVINTFYNRTISKTWINEMIRATGIDNGNNLYAQITLVNQSEVYTTGRYKEFLGIEEGPVYQAVIDFLYTLERKHDYLCFFASYGEIPDSVQFVDGGNWYYSVMPEEDMVLENPSVLARRK